MKKYKFSTRRLTQTSMMLAISTVLSLVCQMIPFLNFPFGGGITIASMLPLIIISTMYGIRWGLFSGFIYSLIQLFLGHVTVAALFTPTSDSFMGIKNAVLICLIDYILAYTVIGLGGLFRMRSKNMSFVLSCGSLVALLLCYVCHTVSGAIFYGAWATWFFNHEAVYALFGEKILSSVSQSALPWIYSLIYNGLYMIPEMLITALAGIAVAKIPFIKVMDKELQ